MSPAILRWLALPLAACACSTVQPFVCTQDEQCQLADAGGVCSIYGFCAYPDPACEFDLRYGDSAGVLDGYCVGDEEQAGFDPPATCTPGAEYCGDGIDGDCAGDPDPSCPMGDRPGTAIDIANTAYANVNIRYANDDYTPSCGGPGGRDVFFDVAFNEPVRLYLDTWGTDFPSILALRRGTCAEQDMSVPELACVDLGCTEELMQHSVNVDAGAYCIVVDQANAGVDAERSRAVLRAVWGPPASDAYVGNMFGTTCDRDDRAWSSCSVGGASEQRWVYTTCGDRVRLSARLSAGGVAISTRWPWFEENACAVDGGTASIDIDSPGIYWLVADDNTPDACEEFNVAVTLESLP